jgi:hypothetical protein
MEHALQRIGRHFYEADNQLELPEEMSALIRVLPGFQTEIANKRFGGNKVGNRSLPLTDPEGAHGREY